MDSDGDGSPAPPTTGTATGNPVSDSPNGSSPIGWQVDLILSLSIMSLLTLFSFIMFAREVFIIRHKQTLRTFILLFTFLNCFVLILYTTLGRVFANRWSEQAEAIGDLITTAIAFMQYFFVILWFHRIAAKSGDRCIDDDFDDDDGSATYRGSSPHLGLAVMIAATIFYLTFGGVLAAQHRFEQFRQYQDLFTFTACTIFFLIGGYRMWYAHRHTNVLDISMETYSVLERSRWTGYVLAGCCFISMASTGISVFGGAQLAKFLNVMDTKYYVCHEWPCLINFFIRLVCMIILPNWLLSYTFSSPSEQNLYLVPLSRGTVVGGAPMVIGEFGGVTSSSPRKDSSEPSSSASSIHRALLTDID